MPIQDVISSYKSDLFKAKVKALPLEAQHAVQQEAIGSFLSDPKMGAMMEIDPDFVINELTLFAQKHFTIPLGVERPSQSGVINPIDDVSIAEALVSPGVLLDPFTLALGGGSGAMVGVQRGLNVAKEALKGTVEAGMGAASLIRPLWRGVKGGANVFRGQEADDLALIANPEGRTAAGKGTINSPGPRPDPHFPTALGAEAKARAAVKKEIEQQQRAIDHSVNNNASPGRLKKQMQRLDRLKKQYKELRFKTSGKVLQESMKQVASTEELQTLVDSVQATPDALANLALREAKDPQQKRLYLQVLEMFTDGEIDPRNVVAIMGRRGMSPEQMARSMGDTWSKAGRDLSKLRQLQEYMRNEARNNPELRKALEELKTYGGGLPTARHGWDVFLNGWGPDIAEGVQLWPGYRKVDAVRKQMLVGQVATTMRNIWSQTGRYGLEVLDQVVQGKMRGTGYGRGPELMQNFLRSLTSKRSRKELADRIDTIMEAYPIEAYRLSTMPLGEANVGSEMMHVLGYLNRTQEEFFRHNIFDAHMRGMIREAGLDLATMVANPKSIPIGIIEKATAAALEATFIGTPKIGTFGRSVLGAYAQLPVLSTVNPYARFWANSMKFLWEFNPTGYARAFMNRDLRKLNPAEYTQILSRAHIGTTMLAGAFAVRGSELGGPKWYQIRAGDRLIDMRPLAPFSTYLFLAEVGRVALKAGKDSVMSDKEFLHLLFEESNITGGDVAQAVIGINRLAGTGLMGIELLRPGMTAEAAAGVMRDFMVQYFSGFTTPIKSVKDIVSGGAQLIGEAANMEALTEFARRENNFPEVKLDPTIGPFLLNFPGGNLALTEGANPLDPGNKPERGVFGFPTGLARQFLGITDKPSRIVSDEYERLGVEPSKVWSQVGEPMVDHAINKRTAKILSGSMETVMQLEAYKGARTATQRLIFNQVALQSKWKAGDQLANSPLPQDKLLQKLREDKAIAKDKKDVVTSIVGVDIERIVREEAERGR